MIQDKPLKRSEREKSSGFTLLELLVVVAIIGVLVTISIPVYNRYIDKARKTVTISTLDSVRKNLEGFRIDNGDYPLSPLNKGTTPWQDASSRKVFSVQLSDQIDQDTNNFNYIYNSAIDSYTITANAKDASASHFTMTPSTLSSP